MEYKVKKRFIDKHTKDFYDARNESFYESTDEKRIKELISKGYIVEKQKEDSLLDGNVSKVQEAITSDLSNEELGKLLKEESEGAKRKGVIQHINSLLETE